MPSVTRPLAALLLVFVCFATAHAQKNNLDELLARNRAYTQADTGKVRLLIRVSGAFNSVNPDSALVYANQALQLAQQVGEPKSIGNSWTAKGIAYSVVGQLHEALDCTQQAKAYYRQAGAEPNLYAALINEGSFYNRISETIRARDTLEYALAQVRRINHVDLQLTALGNLGVAYATLGDLAHAKKNYLAAYDLCAARGDQDGQARNLGNLGEMYYRSADLVKALDYILQSLAINESIENLRGISICFVGLANVYSGLGDYDKSIFYNQKALEIFEQTGNKIGVAISLGNLAQQYELLEQYDKAIDLQQRALALNQQFDLSTGLNYSSLGNLYFQTGQYDRAFEHYKIGLKTTTLANEPVIAQYLWQGLGVCVQKAASAALSRAGYPLESRLDTALLYVQRSLQVAEQINAFDTQSFGWLYLSEIYEQKGDFIQSYSAYKKHIAYRDSLNGEEVKKQATRREIQYEFDKKEAALQFEQQLTKDQLEQQRLLGIQQQQALRLKEQALSLSNRENEVQRLAYLKERAEKQEKEQQLALAEKDKQLQAADLVTLAREKALQLQTLARQNALIGLLLAGLAALLLAALAVYLWLRQRQARREAAVQQQFTHQLFESTEEERGRIARDLHDGVSHELLALRHELKDPTATQRVDRIIDDIRQISRNLHPVMLDSIGLQLSLETLCNQYMEQGELFITHDISYPRRLPANAELQVFRIVQEALSNAIKYAHANAVQVRLSQEGPTLHLLIQDNGRGFEVQQALQSGKAFGLHSIFQRSKAIGAQASIQSSASGTVVKVTV